MDWTDQLLDAMRLEQDPAADRVIERLVADYGPEEARAMFKVLIENIAIRRAKSKTPGRTIYEVFVRRGKKAKNAKRIVRRSKRKGVNQFVVDYEGDPFYWFMHEFGTTKKEARPFMRTAFEAKKQDAVNAMAKRMRKSIERFKKKIERHLLLKPSQTWYFCWTEMVPFLIFKRKNINFTAQEMSKALM